MSETRAFAQLGARMALEAQEIKQGEHMACLVAEGSLRAHAQYLRKRRGHRFAIETLLRLVDEIEPDFKLPAEDK